MPTLWNVAQDAVSKQLEKTAKTVQESREAFQYANLVTSAVESDHSALTSVRKMHPKKEFVGFE
jgi:hypothetical protein